MHRPQAELSRRRFTQLAGLAAAVAAAPASLAAAGPASAAETAAGAHGAAARPAAPDRVAATYHKVLLTHTRWTETQWDAAKGHYTNTDFGFAVVLGHALLLTRAGYDADLAGIDEDTLRSRTLATITHFAASNRLTGGSEWGKTLFFDTTFQLYFVLAARLLWDQLDDATRHNVDTLVREQAAYTTSLGTGDDPLSGSWTPHGLQGGYVGDTKLEEMGVYAQSLAPGLAWASDDSRYAAWSTAYGRWSRNETGLPAADLANPAVVDGVAVSDNTAHNLYDTFIVENHGSFEPHYQCELWRTSGRNTVHFLTAGRPLPEVLTAQPSGDELWESILLVMSDAGEPIMPMINDREHLYGRDVIPIAFLAQVLGDRAAARAETALSERLTAYQAYPPENRVTKFSGEPKYEPEARAEIAISYLLHEWRARQGAAVRALTEREMFARASGARDFGAGPGLVAHQSPKAWAAAVSKPGFVKFAWQPAHDDWLFTVSSGTPMFLPAASARVTGRSVTTHTAVRDGFDASATVLTLDTGRAAFTTLPGGEVVYATTGTAAGEGHLEVFNLTMPGIAGLDGERTYTTAEGATTIRAADAGGDGQPVTGPRTDTVTFAPATYRHVRMQGITGHPKYGYSLYALEVRDGASGTDLARGATATASSADTGKGPSLAVDGDAATRWAVAVADRSHGDSWLAVDLGRAQRFDRVTLDWETAAGRAYRVQGSADGTTWTDLARYPHADATSSGGWVSVDGRAGLVVRGAANPLSVYGDTLVLSDGPAEPLLVEGLPGGSPSAVRAAARRPAPSAADPAVRASTAGGHLSLFNLSDAEVSTAVSVKQDTRAVTLYAGTQTVTATGTEYAGRLAAASAAVAFARCELRSATGGRVPAGVRAEVVDAATVELSGPACRLTLAAPGGRPVRVTLSRGRTRRVTLHGVTPYPLADAALGRPTFPTSPLPHSMSDPAAAVDGDPATSWDPGRDGRMVVDLGAAVPVREIRAAWTGGRVPAASAEFSTDGVTYTTAGRLRTRGRGSSLRAGETARYVALAVGGRRSRDARLVSLAVRTS
ncbi:discoidin domain-containing protein [Streptomyces sp. NRRL F-5126]|uniref:discoidin domain-containing protein n=1 Tax=Streptomyces sp. NRRL F-5126 TaxID=1463857 RepID=UPI0004CAAA12|nr:discoidin domain-containing protein [Streptomyces sp. NRRL F-5126]